MTGDDREPTSLARLGSSTWRELYDMPRRPLLALPIGSCEQHGPHLPLDTDTRIAMALADGLVQAFEPGEVMAAPPITVSASGEHAGFPGTLSIGTDVATDLLIELVRSADWSSGVVFVNGHGGNLAAVQRATAVLEAEQRRVLAWWPRVPEGDAHAGATETSMMLAIAPHLVRRSAIAVGRVEPIGEIVDALRAGGVRSVSPSGVLGDPRQASASHGRNLITRLTIDLVGAVDAWWE